MSFRLFLALIVTCLATRPILAQKLPVSKPEQAGISSAELARVRETMQRRVDDNRTVGAVVAIARHGKVVFLEAFNNEKDGELIKKDSIFRMYSMSKAITTAGAMILADEGKIALNEPVAKYLPGIAAWKLKTPDGLIDPKRQITIQDLMLHTTGMDENAAYAGVERWNARDQGELVKAVTSVPLAHHPGDKWVYSHSIDLLGLVIEKACEKSLADFLEERLLGPLEMRDTAFHVPPEKKDRLALVYRRTDLDPNNGVFRMRGPTEDEMQVVVNHFLSQPKVALGGVGLVGTAEDYLRFLLMIANKGEWNGRRFLSPKAVRLMTTNQLPDGVHPIKTGVQRFGIGFGFGFSVAMEEVNWEVDSPVGEFSWGGAASTHCWVRPEDKLIVVTMEQIFPTNRETRRELRPIIYKAIEQ